MTGMTVSRSFAFEGASEGGREREGKGGKGKKTEKNGASLPL